MIPDTLPTTEDKSTTPPKPNGPQEKVLTIQLLIFTLDQAEYGTNITDIKEITPLGKVTAIPSAPSFIAGIINLRGKIVIVVNLEERFRLVRESTEKPKHIIITEIGEVSFGVIVDEVTGVLRLAQENIKEPPEIIAAKIQVDYLSGVGLLEDRLILLLDLKKVLSESELADLANLAEFHQQRVAKPSQEEKKVDVGAKIEELAKKMAEGTESSRSIKDQQKPDDASATSEPSTPAAPTATQLQAGRNDEEKVEKKVEVKQESKPADSKGKGWKLWPKFGSQ